MSVCVKVNKANNIWMLHFQNSLSEEKENPDIDVSSASVDRERSNLENRVMKLEELLCEAHRECERIKMVSEKSLTLNSTFSNNMSNKQYGKY